jgi:hypothetical protein
LKTYDLTFSAQEWEDIGMKRRQFKNQVKYYPQKTQWVDIVNNKIISMTKLTCCFNFNYKNKNWLGNGFCSECGTKMDVYVKKMLESGEVYCVLKLCQKSTNVEHNKRRAGKIHNYIHIICYAKFILKLSDLSYSVFSIFI